MEAVLSVKHPTRIKKGKQAMPNMGDIKNSKELGKGYRGRFQYIRCPECNKPHWVALATIKDQRAKGLCRSCVSSHIAYANQHRLNSVDARRKRSISMRGSHNPAWKGGVFKTKGGYIELYIYPDNLFFPMASKTHRVKEHRLIMAKHLGRCLNPWEIVHHRNHIKDDNRIDNLQLVSDDSHKQISLSEQRIKRLEDENKALHRYILTLGEEAICNAPIAINVWS